MFYIWLAIVILLTIVEFLTTNLTTIWFVLSAILALLLSLISNNFLLQFIVFMVFGIILLITTRPIILNFLIENQDKTKIDKIFGLPKFIKEEIRKKRSDEKEIDSDNN